MDLDESSPVSEVFQANRIADSAIADQNSVSLFVHLSFTVYPYSALLK